MKKSIIYTITTIASIWFATIGCAPVFGKDFVLVLDAGHGGHDPGAIGEFSREKNINLNIVLKVGRLVQQNCDDVKVIYTRKTDIFIPLDQRTEIANKANADLFISVHTNAAPTKVARGTETFSLGLSRSSANLEVAKRENSVILMEDDYKQRYAGFNPNSAESYIMFEFIQDKHMEQSVSLATLIQKQYKSFSGRSDRGVHQDIFLVLKTSAMPSVLTEVGFISNPEEEQYLNSEEGTDVLAKSIFNAFQQYKLRHDVRRSKIKVPLRPDEDKEQEVKHSYTVDNQEKSDTTNRNIKKSVEGPAKKEERGSTPPKESGLVFKIQILSSAKKLKTSDARFKNLTPVEPFVESGVYKYTYGASENYNKVLRTKREIAAQFKDAFIIAFKDGEKINVNTAIAEFKKNKK
ncbi:N-acetylmuramoyl-L-alanine amidase [uncultured Bacteroides sp.]|uniref:N-acetylmuramoyl-L-alanine amidase family protein n=1 Tax=uncultured Bacteroides sp. TaxID=162156 RepID=UPI002AA93270|nr:N-acetylmuramoyl-L-alanine amidase [uncultured Bacteroides sp.]